MFWKRSGKIRAPQPWSDRSAGSELACRTSPPSKQPKPISRNNNVIADFQAKTRSQSGTDFSIFSDDSYRKDWTVLRNSCITIYRRSETPLAKFEECLQRLEKIVQELERGDVPLENSLALFEEGMQLSSSCRKELEQAEGKVEILLKKNGKLQAEPFEPLSEKAPARR